jgi:hypothetical protein
MEIVKDPILKKKYKIEMNKKYRLNSKLTNEKAQKEFKQFSMLGLVFGAVSLIIFAWLAVLGLAFSARALILANHEGSKANPKRQQYKVMAIAGAALSVIDLALYFGA